MHPSTLFEGFSLWFLAVVASFSPPPPPPPPWLSLSGLIDVVKATDKARLWGPRQTYSVGVEEVKDLLTSRHAPTNIYLMGDAG